MGTRGAQGCFRSPSRRHLLSVWQTRGATRGATTQQKHHLCAAREHHVLICFLYTFSDQDAEIQSKIGTRGDSRMHSGFLSATPVAPLADTWCQKHRHNTFSGLRYVLGSPPDDSVCPFGCQGNQKKRHNTRKATSVYCFRILVDIALPDEQAV